MTLLLFFIAVLLFFVSPRVLVIYCAALVIYQIIQKIEQKRARKQAATNRTAMINAKNTERENRIKEKQDAAQVKQLAKQTAQAEKERARKETQRKQDLNQLTAARNKYETADITLAYYEPIYENLKDATKDETGQTLEKLEKKMYNANIRIAKARADIARYETLKKEYETKYKNPSD